MILTPSVCQSPLQCAFQNGFNNSEQHVDVFQVNCSTMYIIIGFAKKRNTFNCEKCKFLDRKNEKMNV